VEAAEAVGAAGPIEAWEVLDLLLALVDKSLVVAEEHHGATRYHLLETVRQYARDRLLESDRAASEAARARHLAYFVQWAGQAESERRGAEEAFWLDRLELEHDNLSAALRFGLESRDTASLAEGALRLCGAMGTFWLLRGYWGEGREWCATVLTLSVIGQEGLRANVLHLAGELAANQGDSVAARPLLDESLVLAQSAGDKSSVVAALNGLGYLMFAQGDYEAMRSFYEQSLALQRERGDEAGIARILNNLGVHANAQGDSATAQARFEEALIYYRQHNDRVAQALTLSNLGLIATIAGDYPRARPLLEESILLSRGLGNKRALCQTLTILGHVTSEQGNLTEARGLLTECLILCQELGAKGLLPNALEVLAGLLVSEGNAVHAAQLLGYAQQLREALSAPREPSLSSFYERQVARVRSVLDEAAYRAAFEEGRVMTWEQAIELALR
jgi:non-specific serine/threonine protein kinase